MIEIRKLKAEEIDCRVNRINEKGFELLLYKDARADMNILDETFTPIGWQRDHKELKGNIYCGVGVFDKETQQWIWKWDCGSESNTEKEKGEASDSFKRACVNLGIGRELYTSPFIWITPKEKEISKNGKGKLTVKTKFIVSKISYDKSGNIIGLEIKDKNEVRFSGGKI